MKRSWIILGTVIGIPVLLIGLWIVHTSIYPFTSKDPNFADVDAAFSKLQFPADWQEISSTENKGIAGRGCDYFDASGCFHKSKTFKIDDVNGAKKEIKEIIKLQGECVDILEEALPEGNSNTEPLTATSIKCITSNGVAYLASVSTIKGEVGVTATTSY